MQRGALPKHKIVFKGGVMEGHESFRDTLPDYIEIPSDTAGSYRALRYQKREPILGTEIVVYELESQDRPSTGVQATPL
jgi:hypothetical protein